MTGFLFNRACIRTLGIMTGVLLVWIIFILTTTAPSAAALREIDFPTWCPAWDAQSAPCNCSNGSFQAFGFTWCIPSCDAVQAEVTFEDAFRAANCIGEPCPSQGVEPPDTWPEWDALLETARDVWKATCCEPCTDPVSNEEIQCPTAPVGTWSCIELRDFIARATVCNDGALSADEFERLLFVFFNRGVADCAWLMDPDGFEACMQSHLYDDYGSEFFNGLSNRLIAAYCDGPDPPVEDPRSGDDPPGGGEDDEERTNPCDGIVSDDPVDLDRGWKVEPDIEVRVVVPGPDFVIKRLVTSNPYYAGAGLVGENQSLSPFIYIHEQWDEERTHSNGCIEMRWHINVHDLASARRFDAPLTTQWCDPTNPPLPPDGQDVSYKNDGPSTDYIVAGTADVGSSTYPSGA